MGLKRSHRNFFKGKGLTLLLGGCVLAAAVTSVLLLQNGLGSIKKENESFLSSQKKTESESAVREPLEGISKPSQQSPSSSVESSSLPPGENSGEETESSLPLEESEKLLYILPTTGMVSRSFSADELVYYPTLKIWRVHHALDMNAPMGTPVKAMADGYVEKCFEDAVFGVAVRLTHADGKRTTVYGLSDQLLVKEGDAVLVGDVIGTIRGVPAEEGSGIHIIMEDEKGNFLDPLAYIGPKEA